MGYLFSSNLINSEYEDEFGTISTPPKSTGASKTKKVLCFTWVTLVTLLVGLVVAATTLAYLQPQKFIPNIKQNEAHVQQLQQQVNDLLEQLAQLNATLVALDEENRVTISTTRLETMKAITENKEDISKLNLGLQVIKARTEGNDKEIASLNKKVAALNDATIAINVTEQVSTLQSQVSEINQDMAVMDANTQQSFKSLNNKVNTIIDLGLQANATVMHDFMSMQNRVEELNKSYMIIEENNQLMFEQLSSNITAVNETSNVHYEDLNQQFIVVKTELAPCTLACLHGGVPNSGCNQCMNCNEGWKGRLCETPANCAARCEEDQTSCTCAHGGKMNSDTCQCECPTGWTGPLCNDIDPTVSLEDRINYLRGLLNLAQKSYAESHNALRHHLGTGVRTPQHTLSGVPVIQFEYSNITWAANRDLVYAVPDRVEFEPITGGLFYPETDVEVFQDMMDLMDHTRSWDSEMKNVGPQLVMTKQVQEIYNTFFAGSSFMTMVQQSYPLYKIAIPSHVSSTTYKLDPRFQAALDYLPRDLSVDGAMDLYIQVFEFWGTEFIDASVEGGVLGMLSSVRNSLMDSRSGASVAGIGADAEAAFLQAVGRGSAKSVSQTYQSNINFQFVVCAGGNAAEQQQCDPANVQGWKDSLVLSPYVVKYSTVPIFTIIQDEALKTAWQVALLEYSDQQHRLWSGQCIACVHGTCSPPNQYCVCEGNWAGRTCSACAPGFFGPNCEHQNVYLSIGPGSDVAHTSMALAPASYFKCSLTNVYNVCFSGYCDVSYDGNSGYWVLNAGFLGLNGARCITDRVRCAASCVNDH